MTVGGMGARTYKAGWRCFATDVVVSKAERVGSRGASIKANVFGNLETSCKEQESFPGSSSIGFSNYGEYNMRGLLSCLLCWYVKRVVGVEDGAA